MFNTKSLSCQYIKLEYSAAAGGIDLSLKVGRSDYQKKPQAKRPLNND